jgi:hypothetical protein
MKNQIILLPYISWFPDPKLIIKKFRQKAANIFGKHFKAEIKYFSS